MCLCVYVCVCANALTLAVVAVKFICRIATLSLSSLDCLFFCCCCKHSLLLSSMLPPSSPPLIALRLICTTGNRACTRTLYMDVFLSAFVSGGGTKHLDSAVLMINKCLFVEITTQWPFGWLYSSCEYQQLLIHVMLLNCFWTGSNQFPVWY